MSDESTHRWRMPAPYDQQFEQRGQHRQRGRHSGPGRRRSGRPIAMSGEAMATTAVWATSRPMRKAAG